VRVREHNIINMYMSGTYLGMYVGTYYMYRLYDNNTRQLHVDVACTGSVYHATFSICHVFDPSC